MVNICIPKQYYSLWWGLRKCAWKVAGQHLKRSQSFTHLGILFHEDRKIKHAVQAHFSMACVHRPLWGPSSLDIPIANAQTRHDCWSGCSRPCCSLVLRLGVKSGPLLMQQLSASGVPDSAAFLPLPCMPWQEQGSHTWVIFRCLQPTVSYGCEVWAPACSLALDPEIKDMLRIQVAFFCQHCQLRKSVMPNIIFRDFCEGSLA